MKIAPVVLGVLAAASAHASFIVSEPSVRVDAVRGNVLFDLGFSQVPDFTTVDQYGRNLNEWQIMVIEGPPVPYSQNFDSIVRCCEIPDTIVIRAQYPSRTEGSWGPARIQVPFTLTGTQMSFSAPLIDVSPSHPDGHFTYELLAGEYGRSEQEWRLDSYVQGDVPEPSFAWMVGAVLCGLAAASRCLIEPHA